MTKRLIAGGYSPDTPAAIVYKATWEDEKKFVCTVSDLERVAAENGIRKTALILVGRVIASNNYEKSKLYDRSFTTEFRKGRD